MNRMTSAMLSSDSRTLFEKSKRNKISISVPPAVAPETSLLRDIPDYLKRSEDANLPELTEPEIVRHFINLSKKNFSVDTHFYPLGSCTMKYNPKIHEEVAALEGFSWIHPHQNERDVQGILEILYDLERLLCELTGMDAFTLQPAAGAHGELTGMMLTRAYYKAKGESKRNKVIVPDSSHGTNPASAAQYGYEIVQVPSNTRGRVDLEALITVMQDDVACLMLTNPNTLGLFENEILKIRDIAHSKGVLLYYDGANMNALLGNLRPGDMGFDIVHLNLHKTFTTPHGGGGPGAGPVGVKKNLIPFLPLPRLQKGKEGYRFSYEGRASIGKVRSFYGNVGILLRAYVYIRMLGLEGMKRVSHDAVLSANYLRKKLSECYEMPVDEPCMHEFVLTVQNFNEKKLHALDFGKRLLDFGIHAPTVHFPLVVKDAVMIEPTETESKETLDYFADVMLNIYKEACESPEMLRDAPKHTPIGRPDEVQAARKPILSFRDLLREQGSLASNKQER